MKYKFDKAVVIGRFQPFHNGHAAMVRKALEESKTVYILLGSAYAYPNVLNPLTATERERMITSWLLSEFKYEDVARVQFKPIPDYLYNEEKWKTSVRTAIDETKGDNIAIYGYEKDADSYWLKAFGWTHVPVDPVKVDGKDLSATDLRPTIFLHKNGWDEKIARYVPAAVVGSLNGWMMTDTFWRLYYEFEKWEDELEKFKAYPYPDALNCCTGDSVVVCNNHVLVIRRKFAPGKGALALPGGHKNANETFLDCAIRELLEEVRIKVPEKVIRGSIRNSMLFDHPKRSVHFSKPTVAQYIKLEPNNDGSLPRIMGGADDAAEAFWMPMHEVKQKRGEFFDDHYQIIVAFTGL
ncbi:putative bifunctional protein NMN adenylyltransferase/NUDIX hydrolase [Escherichia phage Lw1]|uniref:Bifunctional protein NMN adenylyltransferase/NUDIX hydrolase n=1 Tax=Escherichia phage Lw1 TaxID=1307804 RepID=M9UV80_9CAUD|nr:cytidyltransferase [Escherichia phage Lw1]AGJ71542.1 putative bifunctional protein NMN adenylyltransferase/NUDIX hydrolase [Escherichia phage Lw1]